MTRLSVSPKTIPPGVGYARLAGVGMGLYLLISALSTLVAPSKGNLTPSLLMKESFMIVFGLLLMVPWKKITVPHLWNKLFALFLLMSVIFTFLLLFEALSHHLAMVEAGGKPGPPALKGILIFLGLLQVPSVLFVHKPELLE